MTSRRPLVVPASSVVPGIVVREREREKRVKKYGEESEIDSIDFDFEEREQLPSSSFPLLLSLSLLPRDLDFQRWLL